MLARLRKSAEDKDEGFTLIELLVVIIIIGILAAIAIPVFLNQRKKGVDAGIKSDLRQVANEMESYFTDSQLYPNTAASIPIKKTGTNVISVFLDTNLTKYCVQAWNSKGSTASVTDNYIYQSDNGGLQSTRGVCSTTTYNGATFTFP